MSRRKRARAVAARDGGSDSAFLRWRAGLAGHDARAGDAAAPAARVRRASEATAAASPSRKAADVAAAAKAKETAAAAAAAAAKAAATAVAEEADAARRAAAAAASSKAASVVVRAGRGEARGGLSPGVQRVVPTPPRKTAPQKVRGCSARRSDICPRAVCRRRRP